MNRLQRAARSRRSAVCVLFGVLFILLGFSYLGQAGQIQASAAARASYAAHLRVMPLDGWAWLFIGCGGVATLAGATMWHTVGLSALMGISSWWALEFVASWLSTGYDRAIIGALIWLLLVGNLGIIVGWRDPHPTPSHAALDALLRDP